jgi:hypothetical protein
MHEQRVSPSPSPAPSQPGSPTKVRSHRASGERSGASAGSSPVLSEDHADHTDVHTFPSQVYPIHGAFWPHLPSEQSLARASSVRSVSSVRLEPALPCSGEYEAADSAAPAADAQSARGEAAPAGGEPSEIPHGQGHGQQEDVEEVEVITLDDAPSSYPVPDSPRTPPRAVLVDVAVEVRWPSFRL